MAFIDLPNALGKLYIPEKTGNTPQKHPCPDCFSCQMCSDDRCLQCRGGCRSKRQACTQQRPGPAGHDPTPAPTPSERPPDGEETGSD